MSSKSIMQGLKDKKEHISDEPKKVNKMDEEIIKKSFNLRKSVVEKLEIIRFDEKMKYEGQVVEWAIEELYKMLKEK